MQQQETIGPPVPVPLLPVLTLHDDYTRVGSSGGAPSPSLDSCCQLLCLWLFLVRGDPLG